MDSTTTGQQAIADYFNEQARWRHEKAAEYPEDPRNLRCADGLRELAEYVLGLPPTDERILELTTLGVVGDVFIPPPVSGPPAAAQAEYAISRFRFHDPEEGCGEFLANLVNLMRDDTLAFARQHGELP